MTELSRDGFLGGKLMIWQPQRGYRAGVDSVLLAAYVPAEPDMTVLELGCGVGVASLCLGARIPGLTLAGLEQQPEHAALARRNARENGQSFEVVEGNLAQMPDVLKQRQFDVVMANPPYFDRRASRPGPVPAREAAMGEVTPLATWVDAGARRLRPGGRLAMIHRAERLPELLTLIDARLGSIEVLPLLPRRGRRAELVLISGRKNGRGAFRLRAGLVLHEGARHQRDGDSYTDAVRAVLRHGAALPNDSPAQAKRCN